MRYQMQYEAEGKWYPSASNPPEGSFSTRGEAALAIAIRLRDEKCEMDFRIRPVEDQVSVAPPQ